MKKNTPDSAKSYSTPFALIIFFLTLAIPPFILPNLVDNAFNSPKSLLLLIGVLLMVCIYSVLYLLGKRVIRPGTNVPVIILLLIFLNFFSFFHTQNYFFTVIAATLNISCLLFFYFVSIYIDTRKAFWLLIISAISGIAVAVITCLQSADIFLLIKWASPGNMLMGTIGNSNYLGTYLIFPLFAASGLFFLLKGKLKLIPFFALNLIFIAFILARARASWVGFFLSIFIFFLIILKIYTLPIIKKQFKSNLFIIVPIFIAIVIEVGLFYHISPERFKNTLSIQSIMNIETLYFRFKKYSPPSIWLFKENPVFGTGLWSYRSLVYEAQAEINRVDPDFFKNYDSPKPRRVHNDYLEILNDGGLIAATALLMLFLAIMSHGWAVIKNKDFEFRDRVISTTAFCSLTAMMLSGVFFFPFRVNVTLFMTALMVGIIEAIYLKNHKLIKNVEPWHSQLRVIFIPMVLVLSLGLAWFSGFRPFYGEIEYLKYKKAIGSGKIKKAEQHILKAIQYDKHNTAYSLYAARLYKNFLKDIGKASEYSERAIADFNGDVTKWAAYYIKGLLKFQKGSIKEAKTAFEKCLFYNPTFKAAEIKLNEVNNVLKKHDKILIKLR